MTDPLTAVLKRTPPMTSSDHCWTVTLTAEQVDLIVDLLPQPLERELLEEDLSPTLRHEVERDLERVNDILEILLDAQLIDEALS